MIKSLEQYFIQFGHLEFPQLGSLKLEKREAEWKDGKIIAPHEDIFFECHDAKPARSFYHFLADALNVSTEQVSIQFEQFCNNFISNQTQKIEIGSIGRLIKVNNEIVWESTFNSSNYYNDIELSNTEIPVQLNDNFTPHRRDFWWIWAVVLFLLALLSILYKFI